MRSLWEDRSKHEQARVGRAVVLESSLGVEVNHALQVEEKYFSAGR